MALEPFVAKTVAPGEPLTAQAWNDIVLGLAAVNQYVREAATLSARIRVTPDTASTRRARVVATAAGRPPIQAVAPIGGETHHVLWGLTPGDYTVAVEADGYALGTQALTVNTDGQQSDIALTPTHKTMPSIFGLGLQDALKILGQQGISVARILDSQGRDQPPANVAASYREAPVLATIPDAGELVPPAGGVFILVAGQSAEVVVMPDVRGLTLDQATKALAAVGLVVGKVTTKTS